MYPSGNPTKIFIEHCHHHQSLFNIIYTTAPYPEIKMIVTRDRIYYIQMCIVFRLNHNARTQQQKTMVVIIGRHRLYRMPLLKLQTHSVKATHQRTHITKALPNLTLLTRQLASQTASQPANYNTYNRPSIYAEPWGHFISIWSGFFTFSKIAIYIFIGWSSVCNLSL